MQNTIRSISVYSALLAAMPVLPIAVFFFNQRGLTYTEIFLLQALFAVVIFISEVPCGYIADRYGYVRSLRIAAMLTGAGMALFIFAQTFDIMLLAEVLLGIGSAFYSGTTSSLLYETLSESGKKSAYAQTDAQQAVYITLASAFGMLISGFLVNINVVAPFVVASALSIVAYGVTYFMINASVHTPSQNRVVGFTTVVRSGVNILLGKKHVRIIVLYAVAVFVGLQILRWLQQVFLLSIEANAVWLGVVPGLVGITSFLLIHYKRLYNKVSHNSLIVHVSVITLIGAYCAIAFGSTVSVLIYLYLAYVSGLFFGPFVRSVIHNETHSGIRTTVLSLKNMLHQLVYMTIMPVAGYFLDIYTLQYVAVAFMLMYVAVAILAVFFLLPTARR